MATFRRLVNSVWLWIGLSLALYLLLPLIFPLLPNYDAVPLADVRTFTPTLLEGLGYALLVALLYLFYLLAYRAGRRTGLRLVHILGISLLLALPLLLVRGWLRRPTAFFVVLSIATPLALMISVSLVRLAVAWWQRPGR